MVFACSVTRMRCAEDDKSHSAAATVAVPAVDQIQNLLEQQQLQIISPWSQTLRGATSSTRPPVGAGVPCPARQLLESLLAIGIEDAVLVVLSLLVDPFA